VATRALIKPELLIWARTRAKVAVEDAVQAVNVDAEELQAWESGAEAPTANQLRKLAAKYHVPFVIALARVKRLLIVTDEKPTGSMARPNIPDICTGLQLPTMGLLQLIQAEKWVLG
jgi:transcriptional regulator with XRE-family HTH domain